MLPFIMRGEVEFPCGLKQKAWAVGILLGATFDDPDCPIHGEDCYKPEFAEKLEADEQ
ncbi:hypothetical protein [Natrinema ejinorense]|uniref:hypothetical protein n=1 Tax=Natrinema ejinorense TaxID=373386 RepID=UPI001475E3A4|nr:hypothetical protein [Natrinema ejinorense]